MLRWILAVVGWLAPNLLLGLALGSISPQPHHNPAGTRLDWAAGTLVITGFLASFTFTGLLSMRLALHAAPPTGRAAVAAWGRKLSVLWTVFLGFVLLANGDTPEQRTGLCCFLLWGLGQFLGARWREPLPDRRL